MMSNVVKLHKRHTCKVDVTQGEGMYTAECDALHLVTEAKTFDALTARVWELAPDMIAANGLMIDVDSLCLQFNFTQSAHDTRIAM